LPKYYEVERLTEGRDIFFEHDRISVKLGPKPTLICDDAQLHAAQKSDAFFWVAGGGTLLLNDRYIPIVQRSTSQSVNPGKWSIFGGRADSHAERVMPQLLVRELLEELILLSGDYALRPQIEDQEELIRKVWSQHHQDGLLCSGKEIDITLKQIELPTIEVSIESDGTTTIHSLFAHVNRRKDINIVFLFAADLDLDQLSARDGEQVNGRRLDRKIALLDLLTFNARILSPNATEWWSIEREYMSEHLAATLDALTNIQPKIRAAAREFQHGR